jgi:enamine deaminase RidA (YjgF/YER057c/UK114 family)
MSAIARKVWCETVPEPGAGLFSNCLRAGDTVYVSGQHAGSPQGAVGGTDVFAQTEEALRRVLALVGAAGGSAGDIVKLTIYLTDMARRAEVSRARRAVFSEPMPCSTLVGVNALVAPDLLVEVDAIAVIAPTQSEP